MAMRAYLKGEPPASSQRQRKGSKRRALSGPSTGSVKKPKVQTLKHFHLAKEHKELRQALGYSDNTSHDVVVQETKDLVRDAVAFQKQYQAKSLRVDELTGENQHLRLQIKQLESRLRKQVRGEIGRKTASRSRSHTYQPRRAPASSPFPPRRQQGPARVATTSITKRWWQRRRPPRPQPPRPLAQ